MAKSNNSWQSRTLRILRWLGIVIAVLIAVPVVLTPIYLFVNPISVPMLERYITGRPVVRQWIDIDQVSDRLKAAVIMSEDGQFCRHWGVDFSALRAEVQNQLAGRDTRGASTITMQVARNLFLSNARLGVRKLLEVPLALYIDLVLPKHRIMEIYLNIAEWGPDGQFGIAAGTQTAFGVGPKTLSWTNAALMAVALPNPLVRRPAHASGGLRKLAGIVINRTHQYGERASCVGANGQLAL